VFKKVRIGLKRKVTANPRKKAPAADNLRRQM